MTSLLIDSSVALKWFHDEGEADVAEARALLRAHQQESVSVLLIDLAVYEIGNVLLRRLGWTAEAVDEQIGDLITISGPFLAWEVAWLPTTTSLAEQHRLTFYDASWAAAAAILGIPLVSADRQLLDAGLAESARATASRLRL